jgi:acid phosphatase
MEHCALDGLKNDPAKARRTVLHKQLAAQGCTIIANIGGQTSDLNGGDAGRTFKLADPFYLIK